MPMPKGYHTLGRSTLIEPIEWTADGWYRTKSTATPIKTDPSIKHGLSLSDDFEGPEPGLQWTFWKEYAPQVAQLQETDLWIDAKGSTPSDARLLLATAEDKNYETQVEVNVGKGNTAGLLLYYSEKAYAGVVSDGKNFTIYRNAENSFTLLTSWANASSSRYRIRETVSGWQSARTARNGLRW